MNFHYTIQLPIPPSEAFLWLTDETNMSQWMKELEEFRYINKNSPSLLGSTFIQKVRTPFSTLSWEGKVTAYEQDRLLVLSISSSFFQLHIRYELAGERETTLQKTCKLQPNVWMSAMAPMMASYCSAMFQQQMNKLKECVERKEKRKA